MRPRKPLLICSLLLLGAGWVGCPGKTAPSKTGAKKETEAQRRQREAKEREAQAAKDAAQPTTKPAEKTGK